MLVHDPFGLDGADAFELEDVIDEADEPIAVAGGDFGGMRGSDTHESGTRHCHEKPELLRQFGWSAEARCLARFRREILPRRNIAR